MFILLCFKYAIFYFCPQWKLSTDLTWSTLRNWAQAKGTYRLTILRTVRLRTKHVYQWYQIHVISLSVTVSHFTRRFTPWQGITPSWVHATYAKWVSLTLTHWVPPCGYTLKVPHDCTYCTNLLSSTTYWMSTRGIPHRTWPVHPCFVFCKVLARLVHRLDWYPIKLGQYISTIPLYCPWVLTGWIHRVFPKERDHYTHCNILLFSILRGTGT